MGQEDPSHNGFWNQDLSGLKRSLDTEGTGLSDAEASRRLRRYGPNALAVRKEHLLLAFLSRFTNPLVLLLLAASGISALTGDVTGFAIIATMVLVSSLLDFFQEHRAGAAAARLQQSVAAQATVWRQGDRRRIPMSEVVPGDLVMLAAGDLVPADGRILEARDFFVNQGLLTGESYPVEKRSGQLPAATDMLDQAINAVFMGTAVVSGSARVLVAATGGGTQVGAIAESLQRKPPPTAFESGVRRFGLLIMRVTLLLVFFVFLVNAVFQRPLLESLLFAVALAVGLTPELLPMIVSVTLARGAMRMAGKQVIVKRLEAIHNLGSMDVLCTDKTGTLTEAHIRLERHLDVFGAPSEEVLRLAYVNSAFESGLRSPLDEAILEHREIDIAQWRKIDEVPFDFERRRVSVLAETDGRRLLIVKGAFEETFALCTHYATAQGPQPLDGEVRATARARHDGLAEEGFRVLGIAWRETAIDTNHAAVGDEANLVFAGFAAFLDPPKESAAAAMKSLARLGIAVKIVTGDNELVTRHVCAALGIPVSGVLNGDEIQKLDDPALAARAEVANLFCRVNPAQKNRVILALKSRGHGVGYLGDGANDAPSLHSADAGISVDGAVDVAREAADLILLKHDLHVLHDGVLEGRRTFGNIMKYIMMGTSSNFGNMLSMAGATLFLPFLPMLPVQILLNNLLYDISEIPIPMDRVDREYLQRPHHWDMSFIRNFMWVIGPISSLFDFLTFFVMLKIFEAGEVLFHTGWFIESIATQVLVIFIIRTRFSPWQSRPHPLLIATSLSIVAVAMLLPFSPAASALGLMAPPPAFFAVLAGMLVIYLGIVETAKRWFYRRFARSATARV